MGVTNRVVSRRHSSTGSAEQPRPSSAAASAKSVSAKTGGQPRLDANPELPPIKYPLTTQPSPASFSKGRSSLLAARVTAVTGVTAGVTAGVTGLPIAKGALSAPDRATFDQLAKRNDVPGAAAAPTMKFLMTDVDTAKPKIYLVNSNNIPYHYFFYQQGLAGTLSLEEFNARTYFTDKRKFIAGTIVAHDSYSPTGSAPGSADQGMFALEFWPTDPVKARHIKKVFKAIETAMPFAKGKVAYHPAGDTQEALFKQEQASLKRAGVKTISTDELFHGVTFNALNPGEGFGMLRVFDASAPNPQPPTVRDVVIFKQIPNDLTHVAGILTEDPQTPLSHINLKAQQNNTPNAYLKDATSDPRIAPLIGKLVHYVVGKDGLTIEAATPAQAEAYLEKVRPKKTQKAPRDLTQKNIVDLDELGHGAIKAFGPKVANVAELRQVLGGDMVPDGYGIPFSAYDSFMKKSGLYDEAKAMMADATFKSDPAVREQRLKEFRKKIKNAPLPDELAQQITALQAKFPAGSAIRCRSSTNNEDLEGFNGAGLYDSYTHRPDEGDLSKTVKQVWASLWNYRAFEERDFYRIDHLSAAMGVLVHPNFDDEKANGVAITKNIYDPNWPGFYVNTQVGESLVTNPTPGATPDEFLISAIGPRGEYETQFIRHSSLSDGKNVLTPDQVKQLTAAMERVQAHFKRVYGKADDKNFAMDMEFKIAKNGKLVVKQARPVVE